MHTTTIVDIIEETLGSALSSESGPELEKLNDLDLKRLGRALWEFSDAEWMDVPRFESGDPCFCVHQDSELTKRLGGVGIGGGQIISIGAGDMVGNALVALTYFPRIAVNDGIQYFLDYYDYTWDPTPQRRDIILNILRYYGHCRELIRSGELIVVPRGPWLRVREQPYHNTRAEKRIVALLVRAGFSSPSITVGQLQRMVKGRLAESDVAHELCFPAGLTADDREMLLGGVASKAIRYIGEHFAFCSDTGYSPVIETPILQMAFTSLSKCDAANDTAGRGAVFVERAKVLVPLLSHLPMAEFIAARRSESFEEFRRTIDLIGQETAALEGPLDITDVIRTRLEEARSRVAKTVSASAILRSAVSEGRTIAVGVIGGLLAGAVNPAWGEDPWKLLLTGGVGGVVGVASTTASRLRARAKTGSVSRMFAQLCEYSKTAY